MLYKYKYKAIFKDVFKKTSYNALGGLHALWGFAFHILERELSMVAADVEAGALDQEAVASRKPNSPPLQIQY